MIIIQQFEDASEEKVDDLIILGEQVLQHALLVEPYVQDGGMFLDAVREVVRCMILTQGRVCVRPQLSRALSYVIVAKWKRLGAQVRQAGLVLCYQDSERAVGNDDNSAQVLIANWKRTTNCCVSTFAGSCT